MTPFVRVLEGKRKKFRIFRGTERRDAVTYKGRTLRGYVRVRRVNRQTVTETCFYRMKDKQIVTVPGFDPYWLAARNNITSIKRPEPVREAA